MTGEEGREEGTEEGRVEKEEKRREREKAKGWNERRVWKGGGRSKRENL